jgi:eukaryotic-like serine/threonine-protein kinase
MNIPSRLGKYLLGGVIGEGAMGTVYRGFDPHLRRPVAIKTIRQRLADKYGTASTLAERFRNEAKAAGRLSHRGIVAVYEFGEEAGEAYIATEYVDGCTLERLLATCPVFEEPAIVRIVSQLLDALGSVHEAGIVHRDIKPSNVLVALDGRVKLADFGIASIAGESIPAGSGLAGTPGYIAPEQFLGMPHDHRSDLFAAGVLLYRLLTGDSPFAGPPDEVRHRTVKTHPPAPSAITRGRRGAAFDAVVQKALAKRCEDRWASADEFRRALLQAAGTEVERTWRIRRLPALDQASAKSSSAGTPGAPSAWRAVVAPSSQRANVVCSITVGGVAPGCFGERAHTPWSM